MDVSCSLDRDVKTVNSLGGECCCAVPRCSSSEKLDTSSSDELINYSDVELAVRSECPSYDPEGIAAVTIYDCHPSDNAVGRTSESDCGEGTLREGNHLLRSE